MRRRFPEPPEGPVWHPLVEPAPPDAPGPEAEPAVAPAPGLRLARAFLDAMTTWPAPDRLEVVGPFGHFVVAARDPAWTDIEVGWGQADWQEVCARLEREGYDRVAEGDPADRYRRRAG